MSKNSLLSPKRHAALSCAFVLLAIVMLLTGCEGANEIPDIPIDLAPTNELVIYLPPGSEYWITPAIRLYEQAYPDVNLIIEDFTRMYNPDNYLEYNDRVKTELMAGKGSDLIFPSQLYSTDIYKAMNKGVFLNINEIMENDEDFNPSDYMEIVIESSRHIGRQYILPLSFSVHGINIGSTTKLNEIGFDVSKVTDTVSFMNEVTESLFKAKETPEFQLIFNNNNYLEVLFGASGIKLIDYVNRKVLPDEEKLREFCESYKPYFSTDYSDEQLFTTKHTADILAGKIFFNRPSYSMQVFQDMSVLKTNGGYELTVIRDMDGEVQAVSNDTIAIRSTSPNQLNAWNFIKILLSPEIQCAEYGMTGYPILMEGLDKKIDTEGEGVGTGNDSGYVQITAEDRQALREIITSVSRVNYYNVIIYEIYREAMLPYFADEKSYDECVAELRRKLQLYLDE